jgi:hypothetical protein
MAAISQREARRLKRENLALQEILSEQRKDWRGEWPEGAVIGRIKAGDVMTAIVETARRLNHAVVVTKQGEDIVFFGCKT